MGPGEISVGAISPLAIVWFNFPLLTNWEIFLKLNITIWRDGGYYGTYIVGKFIIILCLIIMKTQHFVIIVNFTFVTVVYCSLLLWLNQYLFEWWYLIIAIIVNVLNLSFYSWVTGGSITSVTPRISRELKKLSVWLFLLSFFISSWVQSSKRSMKISQKGIFSGYCTI